MKMLGEPFRLIARGWRGLGEMVRERWFEFSRDCWKRKAVANATRLREMRKARNRDQCAIEELRTENARLEEELKKSPPLH